MIIRHAERKGTLPGLRGVALALAAAALCAALAACAADNRITLRYAPEGGAAPSAGPVAVASFLDARQDKMLGHNESFQFRPEGRDAAEWVRASLAEELRARGVAVAADGAAPGAAPVVAGTVHEARLVVEGTSHVLDLRFTLTLTRGGDTVFKKTYSGRFERTLLLSSRAESEEMFASALRDLLAGAVPDITSRL